MVTIILRDLLDPTGLLAHVHVASQLDAIGVVRDAVDDALGGRAAAQALEPPGLLVLAAEDGGVDLTAPLYELV